MGKVLLVDTNFSSIPIYTALRGAGHEVHVVGRNPADALAKQASTYWNIDYSDVDALTDLIDEQSFDFLVPGCTDQSYDSSALAGRGLFYGMDSPETISQINNKASFRSLATRLGVPVPAIFTNPEQLYGRDVIVKPVDAFSGKGITRIAQATPEAIEDALVLARISSKTGEAIIEEFVHGQLYSHSAFLVDRRITMDFLVREDATVNNFVVDTSVVLPPNENAALLRGLRECIETIAQNLELQDGLLHTQFIAQPSRFWLIETTRRCPGDLYSMLIELSTGYPYAHGYARSFLGYQPFAGDVGPLRHIMRHTITVPETQVFNHLRLRRSLSIERYISLATVGDVLMPSPLSRIAVAFFREQDRESLNRLYEETLRRDLYIVSDGKA